MRDKKRPESVSEFAPPYVRAGPELKGKAIEAWATLEEDGSWTLSLIYRMPDAAAAAAAAKAEGTENVTFRLPEHLRARAADILALAKQEGDEEGAARAREFAES